MLNFQNDVENMKLCMINSQTFILMKKEKKLQIEERKVGPRKAQ